MCRQRITSTHAPDTYGALACLALMRAYRHVHACSRTRTLALCAYLQPQMLDHTHLDTRGHTPAYISTQTHIHTLSYTKERTYCIHSRTRGASTHEYTRITHVHALTCLRPHMDTGAFMHILLCVCVCVCIDIYTYTYIHTCIHT